jgi:hypothetical protein
MNPEQVLTVNEQPACVFGVGRLPFDYTKERIPGMSEKSHPRPGQTIRIKRDRIQLLHSLNNRIRIHWPSPGSVVCEFPFGDFNRTPKIVSI